MKNRRPFLLILLTLAAITMVQSQTKTYFGAHVTGQPPWINKIVVYNNGGIDAGFTLTVWDTQGQVTLQQDYTAPANGSRVLVMSNFPGYVFGPDEVELVPVEGTLTITTESPKIRPKLSFRYGEEESLTEFFLQDTLAWEYILPNTILDHFSWSGIALMNPYNTPLTVTLKAYLNGTLQGQKEEAVPANTKFVRLSDGIWDLVFYTDFDQVKIAGTEQAFPPPMTVTGNNAQDRHVFFNGAVTASTRPMSAGDLFATDSIVGKLFFVPAGTFTQGSPPDEACRENDLDTETQFTHTLTRNMAVMETEISRQMWSDLKAVQNTLPDDPTDVQYGDGMNNPVQNVTFFEAVLFANLLSAQQGLSPCYYTDDTMTTLVDITNYTVVDEYMIDTIYCHFGADGYRLPTEGEWEYFCRAGTSGPFSVDVPVYDETNCDIAGCFDKSMPYLEDVAWYCYNLYEEPWVYKSKPVGLKLANSWGLKDLMGNVSEICWDKWSIPYPTGTVIDYTGIVQAYRRLCRGGSFKSRASQVRCADREMLLWGGGRSWLTGFRLVRTVQ